MRLALRLARKGRGATSPNPMVGAVVVSASGDLAGSGWHRGPGEPHAEVLALKQAGEKAKAGAVFVNLEPCAHFGLTPPCVHALLDSQVGRVVCSMEDPDHRVAGKGLEALQSAGVEVQVGLLEPDARELNRAYIVHRSLKRPYVTFKVAASLDGRTSAVDGSSRWITSEAARMDVQRLRAESDAVCVGVGTVLADDPELTVRTVRRRGGHGARVIIDSSGRTPVESKVLTEGTPTLIYVSDYTAPGRVQALRAAGAEVIEVGSRGTSVPVDEVLRDLAGKDVVDLLLEGGPTLAGSFAALGTIDRYLLYLAPKLLGGPGTGAIFNGWAAESIGEARTLRVSSVRRVGEDLRIEAFPQVRPAPHDLESRPEGSGQLGTQ